MQFQYGENCGALEGVRDLFPHTSGNVEGTFRGGNEISLEISPPLLRKRLSFNQRVMQTRWGRISPRGEYHHLRKSFRAEIEIFYLEILFEILFSLSAIVNFSEYF